MIQMKPLEITDFSGGITDTILQGDPRRYAKADNFFITNDKKLLERWSIQPLFSTSPWLERGYRVNGLYSVVNDSFVMAQTGRSMYVYNPFTPAMTPINGVASNQPIQGGDLNSQNTYSEFQRKLYFTNDSLIRPSKIYQNTSDVWIAKTAGLPQSWVSGNYTEDGLLTACINLANDLRAKFILHMSNAENLTWNGIPDNAGGALHANLDKWGLSYLEAQDFSDLVAVGATSQIPVPVPTPAPNATDQATLFTLVGALNLAYTRHNTDAKLLIETGSPAVHWDHRLPMGFQIFLGGGTLTPGGPYADIDNAVPDSLEEAAAMLDDLHQKYNWHRKGVFVHSYFNDYTTINQYPLSVSKIGRISMGNTYPTITPDYSDLLGYLVNLSDMYARHIFNNFSTSYHKITNTSQFGFDLAMNLPSPTDLDEMYLTIYWLRSLYYLHNVDANFVDAIHVNYTTTAGSPNVTGITRVDTGASVTAQGNGWDYLTTRARASGGSLLQNMANSQDAYNARTTAAILSSGAGTAVLDRNALTSGSSVGQISTSFYHSATNGLPGLQREFISTTLSINSTSNSLANPPSSIGQNTESWLVLANDLLTALSSHMQDDDIHQRDVANLYRNFILGLPASNPFFVPDTASYVYAFYFSDTYTVGYNGLEYATLGNPIFSDSIEAAISYPVGYTLPTVVGSEEFDVIYNKVVTTRGNLISNLPVLTNDANTNYDLSNVRLNIFRSTDGGKTFWKLTDVANGTLTYLDTVNDTIPGAGETALTSRETMYTTGGIVGYDQPPVCKYTHILNGTTYYAAGLDGDQYFPGRIWQSVPFAPDAVPATFFLDLDDSVTGLSSTRNVLVAFCERSIFRVFGGFNQLGQGSMQYERISDEMGCVNAKSIVQTEVGVFFAGTDGFYYTDGYQIIKISLEIDQTYQKLTQTPEQRRAIYGDYDKATRTIHWSVRANSADTDNSKVYVFYLDFGVKPSGVFTPYTGRENSFRPSSLVFNKGTAIFGHELGFLMKSDPWNKHDLKPDTALAVANWRRLVIPYDFTMLAIDMGTTFNRKYLTKAHFIGENHGNMSIQPYVIRDLDQTGQGRVPMAQINYVGNCWWGNPTFVWGDPNFKWGTRGKMDLWRRFPRNTLRSDFIQLQLVPNENAVVYASSVDFPEFTAALVNISGGTGTVTLSVPAAYTGCPWPLDIIDLEIAFEYDDYTTRFPIVSFTSVARTTINVTDSTSSTVSGTMAWQIMGVKKQQRVSLTSMVIHFGYLGDENESYPGNASNSGPGNGGANP